MAVQTGADFYMDILSRAYDEMASHELCKGCMAQKRQSGLGRRPAWPWVKGVEYLDGLGALTRALRATETDNGPLVPHEYCRVEGEMLGLLRDAIEMSLGRVLGADYGAPYDLPANDAAALAAFCDMERVRKPHVLTLFELAMQKLTHERVAGGNA